MIGRTWRKVRGSVFLKLVAVLVVAGVLINLIVGMFFRQLFGWRGHKVVQQLGDHYMEYVITDFGSPPTVEGARAYAEKFSMKVRYQGKTMGWRTHEDIPPLEVLQHRRYQRHDDAGWYKGSFFRVYRHSTGDYVFMSNFKGLINIDGARVIFLFVILSTVLVVAYLVIRRILRPVRDLSEGVRQVSEGNLDHRISTTRKDELGELANSFNSMSQRISDMLRAKHQLLLDVSHEFRSPLTRMNVALEFLPDDDKTQSLRDDVRSLQVMITEILEGERLASAHGNLDLEEVDLRALVIDIIERGFDEKKRITFSNGSRTVAKVDAERMRLVVRNLIENALKYSDGQIDVSLTAANGDLNLKVTDRGEGIPKDQLNLVFEPFYRLDQSRRHAGAGGYGLGLSLCRKIVEAHGGEIFVESELGKGTTVTVRLLRSQGL